MPNVKLGEFGVYDLILDENSTCTVTTALEPVKANLAILICTIILLTIGVVWRIVIYDDRRQRIKKLGAKGVDFSVSKIPIKNVIYYAFLSFI